MLPGQDGVSRVVNRAAAYQRELGNTLCWITAVPDPHLPEQQLSTFSIPVPGYAPYRMSLGWTQALRARLIAFQPDILHIHAPFWLGWAAARLARQLGIPCVATYHTDFISYASYHGARWLAPGIRWLNRRVYNACTLTLAPSCATQTMLTADGIARTRVLPHGVDTTAFQPRFRSAAWRKPFGADSCILLYVGRLVWEKDLALLAQVLPDLLARRPDVTFVFVGDGPARATLQSQLPQAHFLGYQTGDDLATAYASSDALVFPSATETFGNVTLEAMASGLTCLVADAGGSADLVEHRVTGLKFTPHCAHSLASNLRELVADKTQRRRMAAHALVFAQTQTWEAILDQQQAVYAEAVAHLAYTGATLWVSSDRSQQPTPEAARELPSWHSQLA
ncbi:glycosyltransferase [Siccationidurans ginsengisoli]|nr:glycosyltransferase family 1 protein [Hymenobacter sp. BT559]MBO2033538.1 glycosyltransferase [Hymenobacter sp. BT559]